MNCSRCHQPLPTLTIRGVHYRATKKTRIPKRYIDAGPDEVLYILPIPMLVVEEKGTALKSKPTVAGAVENSK
jgi:hypothetical protein